jgi:hypothetical protein
MRNTRNTLAGKPFGKRPLGRHTRTFKDNITMSLTEIVCNNVD